MVNISSRNIVVEFMFLVWLVSLWNLGLILFIMVLMVELSSLLESISIVGSIRVIFFSVLWFSYKFSGISIMVSIVFSWNEVL